MNNQYMRQVVKERTEKKFYGHDKLKSKYIPKIPEAAEREYSRLAAEYMQIVKEVLEQELPNIKKVYKQERDLAVAENRRSDSATDLLAAINTVFERMSATVAKRCEAFGIRRKLENLSQLTRKLTVKEWKKAIKATLGIDIMEDYYLGDFYREALEAWVEENVNLIKTIPADTLDKMKEIVRDGYEKGSTTTKMVKQIQKQYGISKRHATLIATDQIAKLNSDIQQAQQQDAGIDEYIWYTVGDSRVRDSHRALNGKKFKWSDPPVTEKGRRCNPGKDYRCRCIGRPVFNRNTLNLPIADNGVKVTYR